MPKAELVAADILEILNSYISPRKRKSSSSRWGEHPVRGSVKCLVQITFYIYNLFFFWFFFYSKCVIRCALLIIQNVNDTVAVNKNVRVQIIPHKQGASLQWRRLLLMSNKLIKTFKRRLSLSMSLHRTYKTYIYVDLWNSLIFPDEVLLPKSCGSSVLCYFKYFCTISRSINILILIWFPLFKPIFPSICRLAHNLSQVSMKYGQKDQ